MTQIISQRETFKTIKGVTYRYLDITYRDEQGRRRKTSKSLGRVEQMALTPGDPSSTIHGAELTPQGASERDDIALGDRVIHDLAPGWLGRVVETNGNGKVKCVTLRSHNDFFAMWKSTPTTYAVKYLALAD